MRELKNKEIQGNHSEPIVMKYVKKTVAMPIDKLKNWTNDFDDGESINSDTKKKLAAGIYLKRYRSCQAFFFHFAMILLSCYIGVMFVGWIHIKITQSESGLAVVDNASIWSRLGGLAGAIVCIIIKAVYSHYKNRKYRNYD